MSDFPGKGCRSVKGEGSSLTASAGHLGWNEDSNI